MPRNIREDGERSTGIRPGRVRQAHTSPRPITGTAKNLLRLVRMVSRTTKAPRTRTTSEKGKAASPFQRRCIVNVRYANSKTPGGWKAHGTYVERESARGESDSQKGPDRNAARVAEDRLGLAKQQSLSSLADSWQRDGDGRIFKIILSPEDSAADLERTAEAVISRIREYSGLPVSWGGLIHRNTGHTHAHLIVRGQLQSGDQLRLPPSLIRTGLREVAQASITRQLGPRTMEDIQRQKSV